MITLTSRCRFFSFLRCFPLSWRRKNRDEISLLAKPSNKAGRTVAMSATSPQVLSPPFELRKEEGDMSRSEAFFFFIPLDTSSFSLQRRHRMTFRSPLSFDSFFSLYSECVAKRQFSAECAARPFLLLSSPPPLFFSPERLAKSNGRRLFFPIAATRLI